VEPNEQRRPSPDRRDWLAVLLDATRQIGKVPVKDPYSLYALLHETAGRLAPVHSFYVCLYSARDDNLFFCYNFDAGRYDYPVTVPMGDGPTSWVVRNRRPFVLRDENTEAHRAGIGFGDTERKSRSAVHVPIQAANATGQEQVLGVLSAQSYEPNAYNDAFVDALELLAQSAGVYLQRRQDEAAQRVTAEAAQAQNTRQKQNAIAMTEAFVQMLRTLTKEAEALRPLLPQDNAPLRRAVENLCRACYRSQTEANLFPTFLDKPDPAFADASQRYTLDFLTEREREILSLLASGGTNAAIAEQLCVSVETVRFHCKNLYAKLGVSSRAEAVQAVQRLGSSQAKTTPAR
jgi:DNA-binding CsgD family transcriptional regulator